MEVQKYLAGKTLDDLAAELGIRVARHPTEPLAILNYGITESPKTHPVVRECRGLVLHADTHEVVARAFPRFFNWGEVANEMADFDFSDFYVQSKEDGSLVLIYYFNGAWRANTRGSFGLDKISFAPHTWHQAFCLALGVVDLQDLDNSLDRSLTYVCEFCSPWNKVVRRYQAPRMFLLTAYRGKGEIAHNECDLLANHARFERPQLFHFSSVESIQEFLAKRSTTDQTFEGVVICDRHGHRWKIKSPTYLGLHRLLNNGNIFHPKNLLPFVLSGDDSELLTYFPEAGDAYRECKAKTDAARDEMLSLWEATKAIPVQKDFALAIVGKTPFSSVLFQSRKDGTDPRAVWRESADLIMKKTFHDCEHDAGIPDGFAA